jgi:hypothetical protein
MLHMVQCPVERVLRNRGEEIEWRFRAGDVHPLRDAPIEYGARQAFFGDQLVGALPVPRL